MDYINNKILYDNTTMANYKGYFYKDQLAWGPPNQLRLWA